MNVLLIVSSPISLHQVALGDFRQSRQEIEALAIVKMKELSRIYSKKDPNERDSWRFVSQDVCDTVGIGEARSPPTEEGGGAGETGDGGEKKNNMYDLKAHIDKLTDILEVRGWIYPPTGNIERLYGIPFFF